MILESDVSCILIMCYTCNDSFKGRSTPELCQKCNEIFHRKCLPGVLHKCNRLLSVSTTNVLPKTIPHTTCGNPVNSIFTLPPITQNSVTNLNAEFNQQAYIQNIPNQINQQPLNPNASPFIVNSLCHSHTNTTQSTPITTQSTISVPPKSRSKKNLKTFAPTDRASIETEFKNMQLNAAQARIMELEADVKRLKQSNFILEERIKIFEENRRAGIHNQYFQTSEHVSPQPQPPNSNCCSHAHYPPCQQRITCHHFPPTCSHQPKPNHSCLNTRIDTLSLEVDRIAQNMNKIMLKLDEQQISGLEIPQTWNSYDTPVPTSKPETQAATNQPPNSIDINVDSDDSFDVEMTDNLN